MTTLILDTSEELARHAADLVVAAVKKKPDLLLGAATGQSPVGLYAKLAAAKSAEPDLFDAMRVVQLDEWGGLSENDPASCGSYLQQHLYGPLGIGNDRRIAWNGDAPDREAEVARFKGKLGPAGALDICILGLGANGHIAFNEPAESLERFVHVAQLSPTSMQHGMVAILPSSPDFGFTVGMTDILRSKMILLLVSGASKKDITAKLLSGRISTNLPASLLWLHSNTVCLLDQNACE